MVILLQSVMKNNKNFHTIVTSNIAIMFLVSGHNLSDGGPENFFRRPKKIDPPKISVKSLTPP